MNITRLFYYFFSCCLVSAAACLGVLFFVVHSHSVDFSLLENYNPGKPTILLDDEGNEWARFQFDRREPVLIEDMPLHLINAFLAAEDHNFFNHYGISIQGIIRSVLVNLYRGRRAQGASTITQQLVKLLFLGSKKTFKRKIIEQVYALIVEHQFTKEQILHIYLNHVYFGCGIYGVGAASERFWGKKVHELTIDEAAVLASIIKLPAQYCPLYAPLSCQKRRNFILGWMQRLKTITDEEYQEAVAKPIELKIPEKEQYAPHLKETIRIFLEQRFGKETVYTGGLVVQTTMNKEIQYQAYQSFTNKIDRLRTRLAPDFDGGLLAVEASTGEIKAMIGGFDFSSSSFNRALQAKRQMGSIVKPLIYAAAIEQGASLADVDIDEPLTIMQGSVAWDPRNSNRRFEGPMTLARALSRSNNMITIKTLIKVTPERLIDLLQQCGIEALMHPYPSLSLGCVDISLKEAVGMFNIFANHGEYVEPHCIRWVKDTWGSKVWKKVPRRERVLPAHVCDQVSCVMTENMERMKTVLQANWGAGQAIGKTGTTNDARTCWFAGACPDLTTAIYVGCDDNRVLGDYVYASRTAFPIWLTLQRGLNRFQKDFTFDPRLQKIIIDGKTGEHLTRKRGSEALAILV